MSLKKVQIENKEIIKNLLNKIGAIKYCYCGDCYWSVEDNQAYRLVFCELKKENIEMDGKFVKEAIKQILDEGKSFDDECPHCEFKLK